jgi:hypothetical protein
LSTIQFLTEWVSDGEPGSPDHRGPAIPAARHRDAAHEAQVIMNDGLIIWLTKELRH